MRKKQINELKTAVFDLLVIGGGATGGGIALDAASRGLKVALIERGDFGSGTSSRSTKLIHGGVRYLEQALLNFDVKKLHLVKEALQERKTLLKIAPHLTHPLPLVIPVRTPLQAIWFWGGMKLYDALSGKKSLKGSRWVGKEELYTMIPRLKRGFLGGVLYYDGQFNDSRMALSIILTAIAHTATAANYVELISLNPHIVRDVLTHETFEIKAKRIVNAAGPFADRIRTLDNPNAVPLLEPSRGSHLLFDQAHLNDVGLLIPKTDDGRVLFFLPWEQGALLGTTDIPSRVEDNPLPTQEEEAYLLKHVESYLEGGLTSDAIMGRFSGIRPLLRRKAGERSKDVTRDFMIEESKSGLLTVVGGKWTTYRKMAEALVDRLTSVPSRTQEIELLGQDRSLQLKKFEAMGYNKLLVPGHPFTEAEVCLAIAEEMACTVEDVLLRRMPLGVIDERAGSVARARVEEIFTELFSKAG